MTCEYLGKILGKYDCGCDRDEPDVAVRRCTHPDGLVQLAIEVAPGRGVVDRLRVLLDGAESVETRNVARCQACSLNTDPPKALIRQVAPAVVQAARAAIAATTPPAPPVAGRRTWVDRSRIHPKK